MAGTRGRRLMTALLVGTALVGAGGLGREAAAFAQEAVDFGLGSQPLAAAVAEFGRATRWQVAYPASLAGVRTSPVVGTMAPAEALARMLAGTGIEVRRTGEASAALVQPTPETGAEGGLVLPTLMVTAESATGPVDGLIATESASGTKTATPIIETPQTVNVVGRDQMQQQGATSVSQALRYTPGVVTGTNGAQAGRFDSYFIRGFGGFSADASYASTIDGLRWRFPDRTAVQVDTWMVERVEVVKGPSSTLFGAGSPGGMVNLVTKRPEFEPAGQAYLRFGSPRSAEAGIDVTGPINDTLAYRVVSLARAGDTTVDFQRDERILLAPSLTWTPTDATTVTLQAIYQRDPQAADGQFVPPLGSVLPVPGYGKVSSDFWQGDPNWQQFSRTQTAIGAIIDHDINDSLSFHAAARYGEIDSTSKSLDFGWMSDDVTMNRLVYLADHKAYSTAADAYLQGRVRTGAADHTLIGGIDYQNLSGGFEDGWDLASYPTLNIFDPVYGLDIAPASTFRLFSQPFRQTGLYAQDQVALGNWRFLGGVRHDDISTGSRITNQLNGSVTSSSSSDSELTWRLGAVYMLDNGFAPFLSYSTSFEPELGLTATGDVLTPSSGRMLEAGVRYLSEDGKLWMSATVFSGTRDDIPVVDSVNTATCAEIVGPTATCYTQDNSSEAQGLELEATAELNRGLSLIAGLTLQKVRLTKSSDPAINPDIVNGDTSVDKRLVGVPATTASLWLAYDAEAVPALRGWTFGGGVRYVGSTYGTASNTWGATEGAYDGKASKVPAFTLFDAGVSYDFGALDTRWEGMSVDLRAQNLFDKDYVAACNGYGTCSFGEGRTVQLTLNYTW